MEREKYSGAVRFDHSEIEWRQTNGPTVNVNLHDIAIIGEYTTDAGPFVDDWFLVFIDKSGDFRSISIYAEGMDLLKQHLSEFYHVDLCKYYLTSSTEWNSIIRYPLSLEGKTLFVLTPPEGYKPPTNLLRQIQVAIGFGVYGKSWDVDLTNEVKTYLAL